MYWCWCLYYLYAFIFETVLKTKQNFLGPSHVIVNCVKKLRTKSQRILPIFLFSLANYVKVICIKKLNFFTQILFICEKKFELSIVKNILTIFCNFVSQFVDTIHFNMIWPLVFFFIIQVHRSRVIVCWEFEIFL